MSVAELDLSQLKWDSAGLIPAIVQHNETNEILMMAWMNEESLRRTFQSKQTWFWSRSRQEFWNKGATSGNVQHVHEVLVDCDQDALVVKVTPEGPACHTGEWTCFYRNLAP